MATAQDIIKIAKKYIGVKESPANSNNVIFNTSYYGKAVSGSAYPWCCVFCWYVFKEANASKLFANGQKSALCAFVGNWYKQNGQWYSTPKVGDLVFYKFNRTTNWTNHIGIVAEVNENKKTIVAIEGNTSNGNDSNGGEVMLRTRQYGSGSSVVGFGRPKYDAEKVVSITKYNYLDKIVDVSAYNQNIDYAKMKKAGIGGAIVKFIRKDLNPDKLYTTHVLGFTAVGVPIYGVYTYVYATTVSKAISDAQKGVQILKGAERTTVWLDIEDKTLMGLGERLIDVINAEYDVYSKMGFKIGLYTGLSFYNTYIKPYKSKLKDSNMHLWIARYYKGNTVMPLSEEPNPAYKPLDNIRGWQYTSSGRVDGYAGNIDISKLYTVSSVLGKGSVTATALNVRNKPDTTGKVLSVISRGCTVLIYEKKDGWYRIHPKEQQWVSGKYISLIGV